MAKLDALRLEITVLQPDKFSKECTLWFQIFNSKSQYIEFFRGPYKNQTEAKRWLTKFKKGEN